MWCLCSLSTGQDLQSPWNQSVDVCKGFSLSGGQNLLIHDVYLHLDETEVMNNNFRSETKMNNYKPYVI